MSPQAAAVATVTVVISYVVGMFPTAQLVGHARGVDPTVTGSGNPGATNVYRTAGRRAGALTLAGDLAKGAIAAAIGWALGGHGLGVACGAAAVVGHVAPATRRFRGGKGVATAAGMVFVLFPAAAAVAAAAFGLVALVTHTASVASLAATGLMPLLAALFGAGAGDVAALAGVGGLILVRHLPNIARLARGEERRLRRSR